MKGIERTATIARTYDWRVHDMAEYEVEVLGPDWYYLVVETELGVYRADMQVSIGQWVVWLETPLNPLGTKHLDQTFFIWSPDRAMEAAERAITEVIAQIEPTSGENQKREN